MNNNNTNKVNYINVLLPLMKNCIFYFNKKVFIKKYNNNTCKTMLRIKNIQLLLKLSPISQEQEKNLYKKIKTLSYCVKSYAV